MPVGCRNEIAIPHDQEAVKQDAAFFNVFKHMNQLGGISALFFGQGGFTLLSRPVCWLEFLG